MNKPEKKDFLLEPAMLTVGDFLAGEIGGSKLHAPDNYLKNLQSDKFNPFKMTNDDMIKRLIRKAGERGPQLKQGKINGRELR